MPIKPPTFHPPGVNVWASERERKAMQDRARPSSQARGYDADWRTLRNRFMAAHPQCSEPGCDAPAQEVDHILSVRERPDLRLSWFNLRALCKTHHSARTAREQGFARRPDLRSSDA